jgi:DNA polymerase-3 subunit epsilon
MNFISIDVETANEDMSSICQIGIAVVEDGEITGSHSWYVDPEDYFNPVNVNIHGITENTIKNSPPFNIHAAAINDALKGHFLICHTHFDRVAMKKVAEKYGLPEIDCVWVDSARITRRAWKDEFGSSGYGLSNVCQFLGYEFQHHNAEEDAKAAAHIVLEASKVQGYTTIKEWVENLAKKSTYPEAIKNMGGNPDGNLFGETIAFTGNLIMNRLEAAQKASDAGCNVGGGVTKKTTLLVVGDQDLSKLAGKSKSSKHIKAEKLIEKGSSINILSESDFNKIITN